MAKAFCRVEFGAMAGVAAALVQKRIFAMLKPAVIVTPGTTPPV